LGLHAQGKVLEIYGADARSIGNSVTFAHMSCDNFTKARRWSGTRTPEKVQLSCSLARPNLSARLENFFAELTAGHVRGSGPAGDRSCAEQNQKNIWPICTRAQSPVISAG
jgi:hypothetical protein